MGSTGHVIFRRLCSVGRYRDPGLTTLSMMDFPVRSRLVTCKENQLAGPCHCAASC